ncbi:MAG: prepilin-type N-terminal cleavage/methylation domain-containing protein, partial [Bacilli bacterium]|nr:prepilin-type N-terminal cleavage/methylation domain-containing protein [Bacilli bacterium]MCI9435197.1 prepilin-type N-terminal cleavage/methylation domain-containing protein [Bacilli bacterium]
MKKKGFTLIELLAVII